MKLAVLNKIFHLFVAFSLTLQFLSPTLLLQTAYAADTTTTTADTTTTDPVVTDTPAPEVTAAPTAETTVAPTAAPAVESAPTDNGTQTGDTTLSATVLQDAVTAPALDLSSTTYNQSASLSTDKADYSPTDIAFISGTGLEKNKVYSLTVSSTDDPATSTTVAITTDNTGSFSYSYQLDGNYRPNYSVVIKDGDKVVAQTTFTDANPATDISQCQNGGVGAPLQPCSESAPFPAASGYGYEGNAAANSGNSHWTEGDFVPLRIVATNYSAGAGYIDFSIDITKGGKHAYDYVGSFDTTETLGATAGSHFNHNNPVTDIIAGANPASPDSTGVIPGATLNPFPVACGSNTFGSNTQVPGSIKAWGTSGTLTVSYVSENVGSSDCTTRIRVAWPNTQAGFGGTIVIAYAAHIAKQAEWGTGNSAINISGSPYHSSLVERSTGGDVKGIGNQDAKLSASAIILPSTITIHKVTAPNAADPTVFNFTATGTGYNNFTLTGGNQNVQTVTGTGSYSVTETVPGGWSNTALTCVTATGTGTSSTPNQGGHSVAITIGSGGGGTVDCTYTNTLQTGTLIVKKHVINDNGGSASASAFTLHVKSGASDVTNSPAAGSESGTNYTLNAGAYVVSENTPPTGYTQTGISGDCDANGNVTVVVGQTKTCTITNNDNAPQLHLRKTVTNDNGGGALANAWTLTATGTGGSPTNLSGTTPVDSDGTFKADTYALAESGGPAGYTAGAWNCGGATMPDATHVTVPFSGNVTCTINNNDNAAHLIVIKHVVNNNGGNKLASDFTMTINSVTAVGGNSFAGAESPGTNKTLTTVGSYSVTESGPSGYADSYSADCSGTIALGETKTCTVTNDDIAPQLKLVKVVTKDNGGTAVAGDWELTATGAGGFTAAGDSNTFHNVNAGVQYSLSESGPTGYDPSSWVCTGGGSQSGAKITLGLNESVTCTITNDDQPAHLTLLKTVVNDNGGTAHDIDWTLTADGPTPLSGAEGNAAVTNAVVNAGTYTLGEENGPAGYSAGTYSCVKNGGQPVSSNSITLGLGDSATCTITNNDIQPKLIVIKHVINDNGGTASASSFSMFVTGSSPSPAIFGGDEAGTEVALNAGSYTAGETTDPNYTSSLSADCSGTIAVGETKICTVTNDDIAPQLTVIKHVINNNGGTKEAKDFMMHVGATNVSDPTFAGTESGKTVTLDAGSYLVTETGVAGYAESDSADCSGSIGIGEHKTCTITNDDIAPKLTVIKLVQNSHGGTLGSSDFTMNVDGTNVSDPSFPGSESGKLVTLDQGTYGVTENEVSGYTTVGTSEDCSGTINVGEEKTCTITNGDTKPMITVIKHVINDNGGTAVAGDFTMNVTATNADPVSHPGEEDGRQVSVDAGAYSVDEGAHDGYAKSLSADCSGNIAVGQIKTCTITNDDIQPKLKLVKHVVNNNGGTLGVSDFPLFVDATGVTSGVSHGFNAGDYTASETSNPDYAASDWSGACAADGKVTLHVGDDKTCEITNDDKAPKLHLRKILTNDNGGTATLADFTLTANGTGVNDLTGTSPVDSDGTLKADTFALSENNVAGYSASAWSCVKNNDDAVDGSSITLGLGDEATCTITNNDIAPKLHLRKVVVNNNGGSAVAGDWTLKADGTATNDLSGQTPVDSTGTLQADTFALSETGGPAGYNASAWSCVKNNNPAVDGSSIILGLGDEATCTITNDDLPAHLIVIKHVINNNGGTAVAGAFTTTISGVTTGTPSAAGVESPGVNNTLTSVGAYGVDEGAHVGYNKNLSADCSGTIALGETKTCTITNDDLPAHLIVIKHVINDDGDSASASDFTMHLTGNALSTNDFAGSESGVNVTLNAGSYTANEVDNAGYTKTLSADCSGTIAIGQTKTCTITNNDKPHATRTQGFWQTHTTYTSTVFAGLNPLTIGTHVINTNAKLFAGFYASISKTSTGTKRSQLDQARMQMLQQWLAAELNCKAFGCSAATQTLLANAATAWAGTNTGLIQSYASQLDTYNNSNDALPIAAQGKATPKDSQTLAGNGSFWDVLP